MTGPHHAGGRRARDAPPADDPICQATGGGGGAREAPAVACAGAAEAGARTRVDAGAQADDSERPISGVPRDAEDLVRAVLARRPLRRSMRTGCPALRVAHRVDPLADGRVRYSFWWERAGAPPECKAEATLAAGGALVAFGDAPGATVPLLRALYGSAPRRGALAGNAILRARVALPARWPNSRWNPQAAGAELWTPPTPREDAQAFMDARRASLELSGERGYVPANAHRATCARLAAG